MDENVEDQLVDGGVMDNLPLDAIVGHLSREAAARRLAVRPANDVPHLIFTASLERDPRRSHPAAARVAERWPATLQHARELRYTARSTPLQARNVIFEHLPAVSGPCRGAPAVRWISR